MRKEVRQVKKQNKILHVSFKDEGVFVTKHQLYYILQQYCMTLCDNSSFLTSNWLHINI
jgi:hypothetical protein